MNVKKAAGIVGIILAGILMALGFASATPDKYIRTWGEGAMHEYVGGDAYNFIIEASLRGGEIAGAKTAKAVYFAAAGILFVLSLSFLADDKGKDEIRSDISSAKHEIREVQTAMAQKDKAPAGQQEQQLSSSTVIIEPKEETLPENGDNKTEENE